MSRQFAAFHVLAVDTRILVAEHGRSAALFGGFTRRLPLPIRLRGQTGSSRLLPNGIGCRQEVQRQARCEGLD